MSQSQSQSQPASMSESKSGAGAGSGSVKPQRHGFQKGHKTERSGKKSISIEKRAGDLSMKPQLSTKVARMINGNGIIIGKDAAIASAASTEFLTHHLLSEVDARATARNQILGAKKKSGKGSDKDLHSRITPTNVKEVLSSDPVGRIFKHRTNMKINGTAASDQTFDPRLLTTKGKKKKEKKDKKKKKSTKGKKKSTKGKKKSSKKEEESDDESEKSDDDEEENKKSKKASSKKKTGGTKRKKEESDGDDEPSKKKRKTESGKSSKKGGKGGKSSKKGSKKSS